MNRPVDVNYLAEKRLSRLYFKDGSHGDYFMRGGVCWPKMIERAGGTDIQGFILLAGWNVDTKRITIFEQQEFLVIDHILREDGGIEYKGLAPWFTQMWARYYARGFYWHQEDEAARRHRLEVLRSKMIKPKPTFIFVPWEDTSDAQMAVWKAIKLKSFDSDKGSPLYDQLKASKLGEQQSLPAVHALQCLLAGLERFPWRDLS